MQTHFLFVPIPSFPLGTDFFPKAHEQVFRTLAPLGRGSRWVGEGWKGNALLTWSYSSGWRPWQYESLKATQWRILLSSFLFLKNHKHHKVRPQCWCSWSMGNVQIFNCLYAAHCRSAHVHSPFVFLCHMCLCFFWKCSLCCTLLQLVAN